MAICRKVDKRKQKRGKEKKHNERCSCNKKIDRCCTYKDVMRGWEGVQSLGGIREGVGNGVDREYRREGWRQRRLLEKDYSTSSKTHNTIITPRDNKNPDINRPNSHIAA